jgi:hypothetical protein
MYTLLICWEKLFNFLNSRGPPGVRGRQVKNRCSNVFSKSVGPGHSLQSRKKQFVWGGLQILVERQCWYVERWYSLLLVSVDISQASNITFKFWWLYIHTHCVPLAPTKIQFLGRKDANFEKPTLTPGCEFSEWEYNSFKLYNNNNRFCSCILTPLTLIDM